MGFYSYFRRKRSKLFGIALLVIAVILILGFLKLHQKEPRTVRQDYPDFDDHHQLMEKRGRRSTAERSATEEYVTERINEILNQENSNSGEGGDAETFNWIANLTECEAGAGLEEEENIRFASWENITEEELGIRHPELGPGGSWKPLDCVARNKIAVIIPYRNRHEHLITLLSTLIPLLQRQKLDFRFIVTEQVGTELFNKGRIMNAAFVLAEKLGVDCVIFHDVDMIPEKLNVPYGCPDRQVAMHMGAYLDEFNYTQPYEILVGGVLALNVEDYISVNGYSNLYWGWGAEDDDMGQRLLIRGINISRVDERHHYTMLKHKKRGEEQDFQLEKHFLNRTAKIMVNNGLNRPQWTTVNATATDLYHHILVNVGTPPSFWVRRLHMLKLRRIRQEMQRRATGKPGKKKILKLRKAPSLPTILRKHKLPTGGRKLLMGRRNFKAVRS